MHIGEKILQEILITLEDEYSIYVSQSDWKLFKEPLVVNKNNIIDKTSFEKRQNTSLKIINHILDIHGKTEIVKFLGILASIEPKIQELQTLVRDHVVHAINTFILGVYILDKVNFPSFKGARFDNHFMWKLCGPTHDLGYPIEMSHNIKSSFADEVNSILKKIGSPSPRVDPEIYPMNLNKLCDNYDANEIIQKRLTEWALGINIEKYYDWLKKNNMVDHGVISALAQLKIIDALYNEANPHKEKTEIYKKGLDFNQKYFDLDIVSSSSALFIHNINIKYRGFSNKIAFDIAPLAFLLFLCDTFQEWDRYSESNPVYSGNDFDIICTNNSISLFIPKKLEKKIFKALNKRLSGLLVKVNDKIAVS